MTVRMNVRGHMKALDALMDESRCALCGRQSVPLRVNIPASLSHTGMSRWDVKGIDTCLATIVRALNDAGILTSACCCGHGRSDGTIILQDSRELLVVQNPKGPQSLMMEKPKTCCECGSYECAIPMPIRGRRQDVDLCIADLVAALNAANIVTVCSCCGHGKMKALISLEDGRQLEVCQNAKELEDKVAKMDEN